MKTRRLVSLVASCLPAALSAWGFGCSLLAPSDADLLGGRSSAEGGPPIGDGGPGADRGEVGTEAGGRFCASKDAALCEDFDDPGPATTFSSVWEVGVSSDAVLLRDGDASTSSPNSLLVECPAVTTTQQNSAALIHRLPGSTRGVRQTFDLLIERTDGVRFIVGEVEVRPPAGGLFSTRLAIRNGTITLAEGIYPDGANPTFPEHASRGRLRLGAWMHIVLTSDFESRHAVLDVDGVLTEADLTPGFAAGPTSVFVGIYYADGPTNGSALRVDNVVLERL